MPVQLLSTENWLLRRLGLLPLTLDFILDNFIVKVYLKTCKDRILGNNTYCSFVPNLKKNIIVNKISISPKIFFISMKSDNEQLYN